MINNLIRYSIITCLLVTPFFIAYNLGHKAASFSIAQQCALENSFIEHGNEFYCQDIEDYAGK